jgi:microcystin degradation protein MlrC
LLSPFYLRAKGDKMKKVLVAGLVHETHTFLAQSTPLARFREMVWLHGQAMLEHCRGDLSPMGGALQVADAGNWQLYASRYGAAMPSGTVEDEVLEHWWHDVERDLDAALNQGLDGVLLILHGAMVCRSFDDGEGEVLRRVRDKVGADIPIAADLDLHANFSAEMARYGTIFTGYRENPHTDARAAGERAAQLLERVMGSGERPQVVCFKPGALYGPAGTGTAAEPLRSFEQCARAIERQHPQLLEVCVLPGFAYADIECAGFALVATTLGAAEEARSLLQPLASEVLARVWEGNPQDPAIDEVLPKALHHGAGPIGLVEPSDNIGGGTPGDGTGILQALLRYEVDNAVVIINDPEAAAACHSACIGDRLQLAIGGKVDRLHGPTLELELILENLTDGKFDLENPNSHLASLVGRHVDMGPSAVVRHKGVRILLTTFKTPPMDLGQLRSQGIVPESLYIVGIKAAVSHKAAYDPILKASFYLDTPGLGASDLHRFDFKKVPRPIAPLDA